MNATKSYCSIPSIRIATAGAVAAVVLVGGAIGAAAAPSAVHPGKERSPLSGHMLPPSMKSGPMSSITIKATPTTVKSGQTVVFTGRATGLKTGTTLTLQKKLNGTWVPMGATTSLTKQGSYTLTTALTTAGTQQLRVVNATTTSPWATVLVR